MGKCPKCGHILRENYVHIFGQDEPIIEYECINPKCPSLKIEGTEKRLKENNQI